MIPSNLICPICSSPLTQNGKSLVCRGEKIHSYDMASSGYVNLLPPGKKNNAKAGDGKEMLRARVNFLGGGYYDLISCSIADIISKKLSEKKDMVILDAGCGEGYHLCNITKHLTERFNVSAIGIDASKHGADMGAKASRTLPAFFMAGNIFSLPVADKSVDVLISMFAPIPADEAKRVLRDDGILIVCASGVRHLWEMRCIIYDEPRENTKGIKCPDGFTSDEVYEICEKVHIPSSETLQNLFTMTPFYHRCPFEGRQRLMNTEKLDVTVQVTIEVFKKYNS